MKVGRRVGAIVLLGIIASGCAAGGYNPVSLRSHLVSIGVPKAAAKCVVDGMTHQFGDTRLGARADPSAAELNAERKLLSRCRVKAR